MVAYARVMLIGPGGVGKSSLLNGLMNLPLAHEACSTQLAETYKPRPTESFWAKSGNHWVKITDHDEIDELVKLARAVNIRKHLSTGNQSKSSSKQQFDNADVKKIIDEVLTAISGSSLEGNFFFDIIIIH